MHLSACDFREIRPRERVELEQSDATEIFWEVVSWDNDLSKINIKLNFYVMQALGQNFYNYLRWRGQDEETISKLSETPEVLLEDTKERVKV